MPSRNILVINCGSSSIKFALVNEAHSLFPLHGLAERLGSWLRSNAAELQRIGKETGLALAHLVIGLIVGALISLRSTARVDTHGPLARTLSERCYRLAESFRRVVFA